MIEVLPSGKTIEAVDQTGLKVLEVPGRTLEVLTFGRLDVTGGGGGGGVTDHSALTGLSNDDHPQYHNDVRGDARYAQLSHTHTISNVTNLATQLAAKAPLASPVLTGTPQAPTATTGTNTDQIASTAFVQAAIALLINAAPGLLDTLDEIAQALGDDPNFATTITTALSGKLNSSLVSAFALTLLDDTTAAAMRTTLGFNEAVDDRVAALLLPGTNIGLNYDDVANTLTVNATPQVYVQQTQPAGNGPWIWIQTDGSGNFLDYVVADGTP